LGGGVIGCNAKSITTRIETQINGMYLVIIWCVATLNPLQQGLKPTRIESNKGKDE
jgi:hypothetical protein